MTGVTSTTGPHLADLWHTEGTWETPMCTGDTMTARTTPRPGAAPLERPLARSRYDARPPCTKKW
jgi:hypothetical protein